MLMPVDTTVPGKSALLPWSLEESMKMVGPVGLEPMTN